ncbi:hypothetical protein [Methanothermococcus sp.]|uniref:hypothetical protein n=1 Tax=Methanothermococcus sp. TaxID=2614238 RepID=UPI0025D51E97|nr:hypothetical protein [Methanothermococcus sp.]
MFGFGRGFRGRGFFGFRYFARAPLSNERYEYVGTCRCGLGPHAYYRDRRTGSIIPAAAMYGYDAPTAVVPETELSDRLRYLEEEKRYLEEEIAKLKESLKKE